MSLIQQPLLDRVRHQSKEDADCWIWQGHVKDNLPMINTFIEGKWRCIPVRRAIKINEGVRMWGFQHQARTSCGNKLCVNPEHIVLFAHKGSRGAHSNKQHRTPDQCARYAESARSRIAKLDWDKVNAIRASDETGPVLAERYGVAKTTINSIKAYKLWKPDYSNNPFAGLMR